MTCPSYASRPTAYATIFAMMDKQRIALLIRDREPEIRALGIKNLGLFGSFVREEPHEASDVDLLYEFESGKATLKNFSDLHDLLEDVLQYKVELAPRRYLLSSA